MEQKIEASIMLGSYLDTIGFKNGEFEFNNGLKANTPAEACLISYTTVYHYFILGGINNLSLLKLNASDDTLLLLATGYAVLDDGGEKNYINKYIKWYPKISEPHRAIGYQTNKSILLLKKLTKKYKNKTSLLSKIPYNYNNMMGGNGASIRTSIIGLKWYNNIDKIIEESIICSRLTHNYSIGFLGGLVTALFTSFAFNDIKPWIWIDKLLEIYERKKITNYIHSTDLKNTIDEEIDDFFYFWYKYKEERLPNLIKFRNNPEILDPLKHLNMMLEYNIKLKKECKTGVSCLNLIASSGLDSVIFAYDCLLLSIIPEADYKINLNNVKYSWDSLVFFSCLHIGDSDSTGIIVGSWFGALNGYYNINISKIKELEFYKELKEVCNNLYKQLK